MASWEIDSVGATNSGDLGGARGDVPNTDQRAKRAYAIYTDQHGRAWGAPIENKTGDPCGNFEPQFSAPLRLEDKYIAFNSRMRRITIRYADKIRDLVEAQNEWDTQMRAYARKEYGDKAGEAMKNPPPGLLDLVGPKPHERREPIEAAMQGNKWVLGLSPLKPEWAREFFPDEPVAKRDTFQIETTNRYPDADEDHEPDEDAPGLVWAGRAGWKLPDGSYVRRLTDDNREWAETADEHKGRAEAALAALGG